MSSWAMDREGPAISKSESMTRPSRVRPSDSSISGSTRNGLSQRRWIRSQVIPSSASRAIAVSAFRRAALMATSVTSARAWSTCGISRSIGKLRRCSLT
jgi:hypothetical protein